MNAVSPAPRGSAVAAGPPGATLRRAWADLGEDASALDQVAPPALPPLSAHLPVGALVYDAVAAASLAAARLAGAAAPIVLDPFRVATAVTSERHLLVDDAKPDVWAPLSGFWPTADGWLRTHANYPHHRERLLKILGLPDGTDAEGLRHRLGAVSAQQVEDDATVAGAVAARVRTPGQWLQHPQGIAAAAAPLVALDPLPHAGSDTSAGTNRDPRSPLQGIRVLDLTRVLAGPVATRTLALFGAEVLRVDAPGLAEPEWLHFDTGPGKRSTLLDLSERRDRELFEELLADADVLVTGYRPGALDRLGLGRAEVRARHPRLVVGTVSAWGEEGPWSARRGFDSIVQAASGIAMRESGDGTKPGALPAQALDHSAGYLIAAGVMSSLGRRDRSGEGAGLSVSLARVAAELLGLPPTPSTTPVPGPATTVTLAAEDRTVTLPLPAAQYPGSPVDWPRPPRRFGRDAPRWHRDDTDTDTDTQEKA